MVDKMDARVEPRLYKGFRDLMPDVAAGWWRLVDTIRGVYERYGFSPLITPAIEYLDVLKGADAGEESIRQLFLAKGPEDEPIALRFDLTVALARVVAQYRQELSLPFKRYQVGPVWRGDKPDPGRFREFTQFDIDAVGVPSELAEVEIMAAMADALRELAVGPYRIMFSSRRVLNLLLRFAEVPETLAVEVRDALGTRTEARRDVDVFRVLDKLEKVGAAKVRKELTGGYVDDSGAFVGGLGLSDAQVDRIERFLAIAPGRDGTITGLRTLFGSLPSAAAEIDVLARISDRLGALGYGGDRVVVDLTVARGLGYYTGPVFETVLLDLPRFGSVCSGGRYDDLVRRFLGEAIPATGASIGVDRLLAALVELGRLELRKSAARVLVGTIDPALTGEYLAMAHELRQAGIPTDLYLGAGGIGKQVKHADRSGIPLVVLVGSDERARGTITIKEMDAGKSVASSLTDRASWLSARPGQLEVPRGDLVAAVERLLGGRA